MSARGSSPKALSALDQLSQLFSLLVFKCISTEIRVFIFFIYFVFLSKTVFFGGKKIVKFCFCLFAAYINNEELEQELAVLPKVLTIGGSSQKLTVKCIL